MPRLAVARSANNHGETSGILGKRVELRLSTNSSIPTGSSTSCLIMVNRFLGRQAPRISPCHQVRLISRHKLPIPGLGIPLGIVIEIFCLTQVDAAQDYATIIHANRKTDRSSHRALIWDFRFSSQQPTLYPPLGTPAHKYFLWPGPGLGTESRRCQCKPLTAGRGLPISFCQTPLRPLLALDRFSGSHSLGYPAGSDNPAIRRSILPNNRFVRWLSANSSQ